MAKVRQLQTNFTSGVLDPLLAAREDITFFYNGLEAGKNVLVIPQGGLKRRPGKQRVRKLAKQLSAISLAGATVTAPEGGTAANVKDADEATLLTTTNDISTTDPFVVAHIDFGSAQAVHAVDIINYKLSSLSLSDEFFVQYSTNNTVWSNFGTAFNWDSSSRSRRQKGAAGNVSARYWRIARIGGTSIAAKASIAELRFWSEGSTLSDARLVPFAYSTEEAYMMVGSDRNLDIMTGATYQGSIYVPHTSAQMAVMNYTQSLDTLILFHKSVQPYKVFRQGGDDEFDFRSIDFDNIPKVDYGAGTGGVNEVQVLNVAGTASGDKFTILLEGERTTTITVGATDADTATNIQTALRALSNTSATGITVADATDGFTVTFAGDDGLQPWSEMKVSVLSGNGVWDTARTTKGEYPGEAIMSTTRGWPRCGTFYQQRLFLGGFSSLPNAWTASVLSEFYDLNTEIEDETRALLFRADTDQVSAIYQIVPGRHLTFFTNDSEFYIPTEPINKDSVMKLATRSGIKEGLRVFDVDGALQFIQGVKDEESDLEIGTSVREFLFVDTEQSYQANILSKLSGHLIKNPVDFTLRKAVATGEADIEIMVNEDGTGTAYTLLRNDAVNAFTPIETRAGDNLLRVAVDKKRRVYFITERLIGGTAQRFVEIWNENLLLDCGDLITIEAEEFTATEGQDEYTWTFDNPAEAAAIGVRLNGARLQPEDYSVNLGTKTVTLDPFIADAVAAGDTVRVAKMINQVEGIDDLEGETVQTFIDGTEGDDITITGGVLDLGRYADTEVQYGFDFEVSGKLMPFRIPNTETLTGEKIRVVNAIFNLYQTGSLEIRANGGRWQEVRLMQLDDDVLDRSMMELLFTGEKKKQGLLGIAVGAPLEFRQPGPAPFTLLGITREVSL